MLVHVPDVQVRVDAVGEQARVLVEQHLLSAGVAVLTSPAPASLPGLPIDHRGIVPTTRGRRAWWLVVVAALVVGLFTGFFGVGGGFLVVPALALVMGMGMYQATATALLVITLNSAVAFIPRAGEALDLTATVVVAAFVLISSAVAARWSNRWSERGLGIGFASLVLAMSVLTLAQASGA